MSTAAEPHPPLDAAEPSPTAGLDVDAFKQAFRRLAAGVSAITAVEADGTPRGFTATSLASLAADPPMATFNMARVASAWPAIEQGERVAIHILGARNAGLAATLAGDHDHRFDGDHWERGPHGLPILKDVHAWMIGRIVERVNVAANAVIVVEIEDGGLGTDDDGLLYTERRFVRPGSPA